MTDTQQPVKRETWKDLGFDSTMKNENKKPDFISGEGLDIRLDDMVFNRMLRPRNLPADPQGNEPGKMYWDSTNKTLKVWMGTPIGWYDLINKVHGGMYAYEVSQDVAVAAANTWYEVTTAVTTGPNLYRVSFANSHELIVELAGRYLVNWSMAITTTQANDEIMGTFGVNNVAVDAGASHGTVKTGAAFVSVAGTGIVDLSAGDAISMFVDNESGIRNITFEHITCTLELLTVSGLT